MNNIEKSEKTIAMILNFLLEKGLQEGDLNGGTLKLSDELAPFFTTSYKWLEAEGIVRSAQIVESMNEGIFILNPVLTSHGLSLMDTQIRYGDDMVSVAEAVVSVSSSDRSLSQAGDFTGGFVGGLMKALGSG